MSDYCQSDLDNLKKGDFHTYWVSNSFRILMVFGSNLGAFLFFEPVCFSNFIGVLFFLLLVLLQFLRATRFKNQCCGIAIRLTVRPPLVLAGMRLVRQDLVGTSVST